MEDKETISLNTIIVRYLRHWRLFLLVFFLSFIPAILYLQLFPRTYEFTTSILLQEESESGMSSLGLGGAATLMKSFGIGPSSAGSINIDDELEIFGSNRLQRMMILHLGTSVTYSKPYSLYKMYREAPLKLLADSSTIANLNDEVLFNVAVSPEYVKIKAKTKLGQWKGDFTFKSLPATIIIGSDAFTIDFDNDGATKRAFKLDIRCTPASWMAETVGKKIKVEDVSSASNVLIISYSDHSRQRGLDMLNTLIKTYNTDMESYKRTENLKKMAFVDQRIAKILVDLDKVESELQDFKKKNEMTLLEADVTLYSESFKDIQTALIEVGIQANEINLMDEFLKNPENKYKAIPSVFSVADGEKGVVAQYNKAIINRERLLTNSNELNYMYIAANSEVEILRESVYTMIHNARESVSKTLADLKRKEKELLSKFKSVPDKERQYIGFMRDQEILHGIYLLMLQKREEAVIALGKETDRARMIDPPYIKKKPLGPRKLYAGILVLVLTLVVPVGFLITKDIILSIKHEYQSG